MRSASNLLILKVSHSLSAWGTFAALVCFYADTMLIFTMYGGGFATIPAYLADIFGTMHVGAIHGRLLVCMYVYFTLIIKQRNMLFQLD